MWKASFVRLLRSRPPATWNPLPAGASTTASRCPSPCSDGSNSSSNRGSCFSGFRLTGSRYCSSVVAGGYGDGRAEGKGSVELVSEEEAKRLMRLVNVKALKERLGMEEKEVIGYSELLQACESVGIVKSPEEAAAFARVLDEAGVVWIFGDKVHLHPDLVVHRVRKAVPVALLPEDDPCKHELQKLLEGKEEIEKLAHKQVRRILWIGMCGTSVQIGFFFRLTFWEFSWDIMEPVAFFITATGIIIGYAYFLFTSRDPTYQDIYKRLFLSRMKKLVKKRSFDIHRLAELQKKCKLPLDVPTSGKRRMGVKWELDELLH
ncbi:hypothetical protein DM860_012069 [Cuscuta australis]|uniref:Calcium uniporter protein C-terminal domain-containing protein n=1 Tax=Cuscuta australis TaxID=267555 RepID=A0A328D9X3_9ASTE|nr:hypothetical protein DM860_012069 [Cuscuta australis]